MQKMKILVSLMVTGALLLGGCEKHPAGSDSGETTPPAGATKAKAPGADESDAAASKGPGHGGAVIELGETSIDGMTIRASRDAGEIRAGGDSPIDIWIDGGLGNASAVRFWIGSEDAKGSIKAKAAVEDGHWHTHAEVPDPLPADSRLWVQIEHKNDTSSLVSFDLKA